MHNSQLCWSCNGFVGMPLKAEFRSGVCVKRERLRELSLYQAKVPYKIAWMKSMKREPFLIISSKLSPPKKKKKNLNHECWIAPLPYRNSTRTYNAFTLEVKSNSMNEVNEKRTFLNNIKQIVTPQKKILKILNFFKKTMNVESLHWLVGIQLGLIMHSHLKLNQYVKWKSRWHPRWHPMLNGQ